MRFCNWFWCNAKFFSSRAANACFSNCKFDVLFTASIAIKFKLRDWLELSAMFDNLSDIFTLFAISTSEFSLDCDPFSESISIFCHPRLDLKLKFSNGNERIGLHDHY